MSEVVLDASALLVLLNAEPGATMVAGMLPGAAISAVNLSEVVAKLADKGMPLEAIRTALNGLGLVIHPFDETAAFDAGTLRPRTRSTGLSFGDRACLALGKALSLPVVTSDRRWKSVEPAIAVKLLR